MKNNPILQIFKMLLGGVGTYYFGAMLMRCYDPYVAVVFLIPTLGCAVVAMHGYLKFKGEY